MPKALVRALFLHLFSFPLYIMLDTSGTLNNYCPHYPNMEVHMYHIINLIRVYLSQSISAQIHTVGPEM